MSSIAQRCDRRGHSEAAGEAHRPIRHHGVRDHGRRRQGGGRAVPGHRRERRRSVGAAGDDAPAAEPRVTVDNSAVLRIGDQRGHRHAVELGERPPRQSPVRRSPRPAVAQRVQPSRPDGVEHRRIRPLARRGEVRAGVGAARQPVDRLHEHGGRVQRIHGDRLEVRGLADQRPVRAGIRRGVDPGREVALQHRVDARTARGHLAHLPSRERERAGHRRPGRAGVAGAENSALAGHVYRPHLSRHGHDRHRRKPGGQRVRRPRGTAVGADLQRRAGAQAVEPATGATDGRCLGRVHDRVGHQGERAAGGRPPPQVVFADGERGARGGGVRLAALAHGGVGAADRAGDETGRGAEEQRRRIGRVDPVEEARSGAERVPGAALVGAPEQRVGRVREVQGGRRCREVAVHRRHRRRGDRPRRPAVCRRPQLVVQRQRGIARSGADHQPAEPRVDDRGPPRHAGVTAGRDDALVAPATLDHVDQPGHGRIGEHPRADGRPAGDQRRRPRAPGRTVVVADVERLVERRVGAPAEGVDAAGGIGCDGVCRDRGGRPRLAAVRAGRQLVVDRHVRVSGPAHRDGVDAAVRCLRAEADVHPGVRQRRRRSGAAGADRECECHRGDNPPPANPAAHLGSSLRAAGGLVNRLQKPFRSGRAARPVACRPTRTGARPARCPHGHRARRASRPASDSVAGRVSVNTGPCTGRAPSGAPARCTRPTRRASGARTPRRCARRAPRAPPRRPRARRSRGSGRAAGW